MKLDLKKVKLSKKKPSAIAPGLDMVAKMIGKKNA